MWFYWGLLTAFIHAIALILQKRVLTRISTLVVTWSLFAFSLPILAVWAFWQGTPQVNQTFLLTVALSAVFFSVSKTITMLAVKGSSLSQLVPLSTFSVASTYLIGVLLLNEVLKPTNLLGLGFIAIGAYTLNAQNTGKNILKPFKLLFSNFHSRLYLLGYLVGGGIAVIDKIAVNNTFPTNPAFALFMENFILTGILTATLQVRKKHWLTEVKQHFKPLLVTGLVYKLSILALFYGYSTGPAALLIGVKKLEIFFTLILAYLFFGDKPSKYSFTASLIMILGVVLIRL